MVRGMRGAHLLAVIVTFSMTLLRDAKGQDSFNALTGFSLSPPYFNIAEGSRISATATCGQDEAGSPRYDLFCKLVGGPNKFRPNPGLPTQNIQGQFCDFCNSIDPSKAHPVTNAIDGTERWWQSPPLSKGAGYNEVNVTLDLGQLFHVAYILIKFANSPRPDLWVLERSVDHGRTYSPWQYFAHSKRECIERFGKQPNSRVLKDDDQLCTTEYSRIIPLENGEIVVSLVNGRPGSRNFTYSPVLRDFTKATNIRLRFLRTSTLLGHLISKAQRDPTVTRRYYYSIKDISVGGRCVCHGHAQACGRRNQDNSNGRQCECKHNACGESCDRCCPGFNQKPWRAATIDSPNECQPCQCFSHAVDCYYDPEVEQKGASLDTFGRYDGGGVCIHCQHNTAGVNCERCMEGFYRPYGIPPESPTGCIPCRCDGRTTAGCEMGSGRCICRPEFTGENCDRCADGYHGYPQCNQPSVCPPGYFGSPSCQQCVCDYRGTANEVCDDSGRCLCRQGVEGQRCDRCQPGYHTFPTCQACVCDGAGVVNHVCSSDGQCVCLPNYEGQQCDQCASGYYGYPDCAACQCSREGSYGTTCNPLSGQCLCLPGVVGQMCDRCAASGLRFPQCSAAISQCNPAGSELMDPRTGSCRCLPNVEGTLCDKCKPLHWNLAKGSRRGCTECRCDLKGTLSGVGECSQKNGQCHCKPNACGHACDTCEDGYFLLQKRNYFGCQGCRCDAGGAIGRACDEASGQCRCRKNIVGRTCDEPAPNYYLPTLHQMKFEVEDGTTPNSRPVRFGYDPREFPVFSWRGYAIMSPAQSEVRVTVHVDPIDSRPHLFRVVLRFTNPSSTSVTGSIKATNNRGTTGSEQSKEVVFPASPSPTFLTVPGEGFAEPFALTPGKWIIIIRAEGILLDYLVLLPRDYYEAPLLQENITQPCTYISTANGDTNCLLYKHVSMDGFSSVLGSLGTLSSRSGRRRRQARVRRPTADHPEMAALNGRQSQLQLSLRVARPGPHALILEYASEVDNVQNVNILISGQWSNGQIPARANIYSCAYSFLCRSVAVDSSNRVAVLQLSHRTDLLLQTSTTSFLLYKVYAVPTEDFSMEYVDPKVLCVSTHGRFTEDSQYCVARRFDRPTTAWVLDAARGGQLSSTPAIAPQRGQIEEWRRRRQSGVPRESQSDGVLLKYPQNKINFNPKVPVPGRYVVLVHFHQPEHASFPVEVRVDAGREWRGSINASFCPAVSGCREVVIADGRIALDFDQHSWRPPAISVIIPPRETLTLDYILLVPDSNYTPDLLKEKPLDKSADFIHLCRGDGFYIDPRTSSQFCRESARSLVAAYNDGALPCNCDKSGSTGTACDPVGGQCLCRRHVIGRRCTKCATGFYGFPYCRPCQCGRRLCDEVTGRCICPPQTIKPACDVCQNQTFSYHPLLGCEDCECSPNGIKTSAGPDCDRITGQCICKPRIGGRQCDRCAAGYYGFPNCVPCDCNQGGVTPDVCHPDTGECLCKRNVAGVRCDACREGSFYFDPSNPQGCTRCFCFGATDHCQSSSKRRGKFVEMRGWRLENVDQEEIPSVLNTASNAVVADIQELPPTIQVLHWVAPPSSLGDRVSSYGGFLTYQTKSFGIPSEGMTLMDRRPDVLLSGKDMTLIHLAPQLPLPDRLYQGRVQLVEGNWRHAGSNRPVSREELMTVLAGLVGLRIRALYFTRSQRLSLGEVGIEEASNTGAGGPGNTVEKCSCPPEYSGDSCEKCAPGYYRDGSGPYLGLCVPCDCNDLTNECEERTGRCLNCRHNTAGDRCERCKEGYYGNPAQKTCRVCPCPFRTPTNSFAIGCRETKGDFQCKCKTGYTGDRCERCAAGFYGDPLTSGGSCQPCNCNGNGNNCNARTGECKDTLEPKDTNTDEHCQECDSCAQALLHDLEKLDNEMGRIKAQLDNFTASTASQDRLKKLEKAVSDTKILVNKFSSSINKLKPKVNQLEQDMLTLKDDISYLKDKADKRATDADKAVTVVEKTHKRAKDLDSEVRNMLKKIQALLDQLRELGSGDKPLSEDLAKMLDEAQRMVTEMEKRNFTPQKTAAERERTEAKKLLEYIKANVSKQCDQNEAAADKIRDLLKGYEAKLKDLDEALKEAVDLVKKANTQNGLNALALEDLLKRIADLKKERKIVQDQIALAEDELQKTEDLLKMLSDSKMEYEQLAAQMDGAKTDLTKKVNELSQAAAQEDIVEDAEEHARNLNKLAKELEDAVKDASGRSEVRNAKDAIDAYKDITEAINAAEAAANEAKQAADDAFNNVKDKNLTQRAKDLKDKGDDLLTDARDAEKNLQDKIDDLTALKRNLKNADKKKKALEKDLLDAQTALNDIKRDDIGNMIDDAKRKASSANDTAGTTMDKLKTIKDEIDKISVTPVDSNLSSVMDDVDKSVKNLLKTIPSLNDKISEMVNLTTQFSPLSNISENIKKIKELIEQARDAANRISIPMKFTGDGHVELRPPKNLEDLKAYTALSLSLQRPMSRGDGARRRRQTRDKGDMFVLYLGNKDSSKDYIGMALRKNILYSVYKLNGAEYEIKTDFITMSVSEPAKFDKVDLHRIYQDVKVILTKDVTSTSPANSKMTSNQGDEIKNLLDLSPSDVVFYVGGYPANFTPPASLNYPMYKGCIELASLNDRVISLYNFQNSDKINLETPCKRYVPPMDSDFYEGTGYAKVTIDKVLSTLLISMTVNTRSENGLLFYIGNEEKYYSLTIEKGIIHVHSNLLSEPATKNSKMSPTDDWVEILIIISSSGKKEMEVRVASTSAATAKVDYNRGEFKEYYIGGVPQDLREKFNITMQPFKGCIKNVKLNKDFRPVEDKVGVSKGCPKESLGSRKAELNLGSSLSADLSGFSLADDVTVSLGFKSTEYEGLLLQNKEGANGINVALVGGYVVLTFNRKMWKSNKQYQDGKWHYLTVAKRAGSVELLIDDEDAGQQHSASITIPNTAGSMVLGQGQFKGCLSNLYTRRPENLFKPEDLSRFKTSGNVLLDVCTGDRPAQLMVDRYLKKDSVMVAVNDSVSECALPAVLQHAYRMGGPVSSLSYSLPPQALQSKPHFSLDVRTRSPEGLLFFVATRGGRSHLALYMSKGRIRLSVGRDREIFNREKYNDGKWHSVIFSLERKKFRLVVDGIKAQDGQMTNAELASMGFVSPVYLGSAPESLHKELKWKDLPKQSVSGCVRSFKMNGALMSEPTTNHGAGPCFEGQTQRAAYFSGNGGYVVVNDSFAVGPSFELLFDIRPRSPTGLLLHVGNPGRTRHGALTAHYLSVYMLRGEVVAQVNNGEGEFMVSVQPKATLCDGMFHKISVIKRKNVVQLHVDTMGNYKIGPPSSLTALTKDPLYVGGVPEMPLQQTLPVTSSFVGCIQDMRINGEPVSLDRMSGVFGPVNLKECPAG